MDGLEKRMQILPEMKIEIK